MRSRTALADQPSMDDLKIGPAGQTFGQLKQAVIDARAAFMCSLLQDDARVGAEALMAYESAVRLLEAAYVRVGLPYTAP